MGGCILNWVEFVPNGYLIWLGQKNTSNAILRQKEYVKKKCQDCIFDNLEGLVKKRYLLLVFKVWKLKTDQWRKWYEKDIDQRGQLMEKNILGLFCLC